MTMTMTRAMTGTRIYMINIQNVPAPKDLPAPLQPKDMSNPAELNPELPQEIPLNTWVNSEFLQKLWVVPPPFFKQFGFNRTAEAWLINHPEIAKSFEILMDFMKVPCPLSQEVGGVASAAMAIISWSMVMYKAVKEDAAHGNTKTRTFSEVSEHNFSDISANQSNTGNVNAPN